MAGIQGIVNDTKPIQAEKFLQQIFGYMFRLGPVPQSFLFGVRLALRFAFIIIDIDSRATLE